MSKQNKKAIIVTTAHRGVFFGYAVPTTDKIIRLEDAQMCVYWSSDMHGIGGLASQGPSNSCKIGPPVPAITLQDITSIIEVSPKAELAWKHQPWN